MNDHWQQFLQSQGATLSDQGVAQFIDAPLLPDCALCDISSHGLIRVSGPDSREFLQGQFTNDVTQVTPEHSQLSSFCSPKGRMLALFRIFQRGDDLYLMLPRERLAATLKRLSMFILRAQVNLSDASDELAIAGIAGDCAAPLVPQAPSDTDGSTTVGELTVIRLAGDRERFLLIGDAATMQTWWQQAAAQATPASSDCWPLLDIRAGIPSVVEPTTEAFVPQMANLQLLNGVSFTKGCYTGQEVVARMQYLGTLKRRMYRVRIDSDHCPPPGTELFSPSSASGQGAGRVVDARPGPDGGCEALVVSQISSMEEARDLRLGSAEGPMLSSLSLPYCFESAETTH
jgi:folate-binding protein YgfZ